jgi:hypothetical protein
MRAYLLPIALCLTLAPLLLTARATAQDEPTPPPETPTPTPPPQRSGAHVHDDFYLRFSAGPGGLGLRRTLTAPSGSTQGGKVQGGATAIELSIGGTPARGLVLAGSLLGFSHRSPDYVPDGGAKVELDGTLDVSMLGATIDWFPYPEKGFHFGGTLGLANAKAPSPIVDPRPEIGGGGLGLALDVGYDFWIGEQWSLGVLGRFAFAGVQDRTARTEGTYKEKDSLAAFGVMATVLYH